MDKRKSYKQRYNINLYNDDEISEIKKQANIASKILDIICSEYVKPGVTAKEVDELAFKLHEKFNVKPAPLGYGEPPYPSSICFSQNDIICHGVPKDYVIKNGDIINIDVSVTDGKFFGDCSKMVAIGEISDRNKKLIEASYNSVVNCAKILGPGKSINIIGNYIENYVKSEQFLVAKEFIGHGIGRAFHELPNIFHTKNNFKLELAPGMIFTIEPIIIDGNNENYFIDRKDHWTVYSKDKFLSAQHEHMFLITENGCEILTSWKR